MLSTTIKKLHGKLKASSVGVDEIINTCLKRADQMKDLNAYITLNTESQKDVDNATQLIKEGKCRTPMEGVPIAVKDNFCIKDLPTTCGSKMLKNFVPKYTATVVEKLLSAGAIVIGKTNLDEFAMGSGTTTSIFGPTKNIWGSKYSNILMQDTDDWFIAGGSSGGSAVAVASGTCLGALGSDTGGSCRNPASYCGIVGLKPTYGLLSRHGLIPLVNSMDVPGILALNVEDASILLGITAGKDENDSTTVESDINLNLNFSSSSVKGLKIGIPLEYNCEGLSDEIKSTWDDVAKILDGGGATVVPVSMPHTKYSIVCYSILNQCEVASNMARYDGVEYGHRSSNHSRNGMYSESRSAAFNDIVRSRILGGNYFLLSSSKNYFEKALKVRRLIVEDFKTVWEKGINILLTPTTLTDAPRYSEYKEKDEREQSMTQDYCTQPANMAGCPAITIPIELSKNGFPLSLQLMAPNFNEKTLLECAMYIENAVNFGQYRNKFIL